MNSTSGLASEAENCKFWAHAFCAGTIIFGKDSQNIDFYCPKHKTCFFYLLVQILCHNVILIKSEWKKKNKDKLYCFCFIIRSVCTFKYFHKGTERIYVSLFCFYRNFVFVELGPCSNDTCLFVKLSTTWFFALFLK